MLTFSKFKKGQDRILSVYSSVNGKLKKLKTFERLLDSTYPFLLFADGTLIIEGPYKLYIWKFLTNKVNA